MNDEKFELTISDLAGSGTYYADIADELRARDTAQREALARAEAERDTAIVQMQNIRKNRDRLNKEQCDTEFTLCIAQVQLAEAVGLIDQHFNDLGDACCSFESQHDVDTVTRFLDVLQAFLARHAQGEQQEADPSEYYCKVCRNHGCVSGCHPDYYRQVEAQGEQPGDELVAKAIYDSDRSVFMSKREYAELHHTTKARLLKMARAALATQPADSIAVNRLRLSLVAWDAELAEQDYQLTADDLRDKLREIHRDIDRLMPEQGQAAVRGAEHE